MSFEHVSERSAVPVCVIVVHWKMSETTEESVVRALEPNVTQCYLCRSETAEHRPSVGNIRTEAATVKTNIVAKQNRLNLQESQLKLNCESGITLYIKKEKTISLYLLLLFLPLFNLWSGLKIRFVAGVLFFQFM